MILVLAGVGVVGASFAVDVVGVGSDTRFGWKQSVAIAAGGVCLIAGATTWRRPDMAQSALKSARSASRRFLTGKPALVPFLLGAIFYVLFLANSVFSVQRERYFSLFDDAMISMRYARHLADGVGLVWNPGEQVEGYTNFLWTLWMAALHLLPIPESKVALLVMLSGAALLFANLLVIRALVRRVAPGSRLAVFAALLLAALFYPLVYWTLRGMEVGLVSLVLSGMALQSLRIRDVPTAGRGLALAAVMAVGVLTRDEMIVPALIVTVSLLMSVPAGKRLAAMAPLLGVLCVIGLHEGFRVLYYGDPLPNTYYLKLAGTTLSERMARGLAVLGNQIVLQLGLTLVVAGSALGSRRAVSPGLWLLAAMYAGQAFYSIYVGGDAWEATVAINRYVAPAVPLLFVLAAVACQSLLTDALGRRSQLALVFALVTLASVTLLWPPAGVRELTQVSVDYSATRAIMLVLAALAVIAITLSWRGRAREVVPHMATFLLVGLLVGTTNWFSILGWHEYGAVYLKEDAEMTRYALEIRRQTPPDVTVAVTWAGALPYFMHRKTVDLLGKTDPVVARGPVRGTLYPGHNKWDDRHSIGRRRPDVVAQLWRPRAEDYRLLRRVGYQVIPPTVLAPPRFAGQSFSQVRAFCLATLYRRADSSPALPRECEGEPLVVARAQNYDEVGASRDGRGAEGVAGLARERAEKLEALAAERDRRPSR